MKILLFVLVLFINFIYAQNNMWPLSNGNKYQYYYYSTGSDSRYYQIDSNKVIKDTVINQKKYYAFNDSGNFFRYDPDSNKAYLWFNQYEGLYCDFNLPNGSTFAQFSSFWHTYEDVTISTDVKTLFGVNIKTVSWKTSYGWERRSETFAEGLGIIAKGSSAFGPGPDYDANAILINAILYDSLGNFSYYSNGYLPTITFQPIIIHRDSVLDYFSVQVDHFYNKYNYFMGNKSDGIVYIDSVFLEFYYQNKSQQTTVQKIRAERSPKTNIYNFILPIDTNLASASYDLFYRIGATDMSLMPQLKFSPDSGYYQVTFTPSDTKNDQIVNNRFYLFQNYPNPFNPTTTIHYSLKESGKVDLAVYNMLGQKVFTLVNEFQNTGNHQVQFDASHLASGIYVYRIKANSFTSSKKLLLLK